jgi:uncharacterized RmlC-like cupin family protein
MTAEEAAHYLRYPSTLWFLKSVKKHGIPCIRRGRRIFFTRDGLDQFMSVATETTKETRRRRKKAH